MSWVPDEILEEILSLLPVKSLLRLRCVSKSWLALMGTPYFVKLHLKRSAQTKTNLSVFLKSHRLYRVDFHSLDGRDIQPSVVDYHPMNFLNFFQVWGSCDGLMCISYLNDDVFLWNPATRKSLKLPYKSVEVPNLSDLKHQSHYRIAYTCNDYKVVRIVEILDSHEDFFDYQIMVYSLRSNSWHSSEKFPDSLNLSSTGYTVVGGALHWISEWEENGRIVAFDIGTEQYRVILMPDYRGPRFLNCLHPFQGCLSLSFHYDSLTADIWLLKEYGGKNESWSRLITMMPISPTNKFLGSMAYSKCGKKILLRMDFNKIVWYNLEQKSVEDITVHGMKEENDIFLGFVCWESLVSVDVKNLQEDQKNWRSRLEPIMNSDSMRKRGHRYL